MADQSNRPELGEWCIVTGIAQRQKSHRDRGNYDKGIEPSENVSWHPKKTPPRNAMYIGFRFVQEGKLEFSWNGEEACLKATKYIEVWVFVEKARELPFMVLPEQVMRNADMEPAGAYPWSVSNKPVLSRSNGL